MKLEDLKKDAQVKGIQAGEPVRIVTVERVHEIRASVQSGTPLGNDRFKNLIERRLKQSVGQAKRGRPRKTREKGAPIFPKGY